jgi:outer membrane protein assembly factor BamB
MTAAAALLLGLALQTSDGLVASPEAGWPQWRGPRRDGVSDEKGLLRAWPAGGPKLLWKAEGLGRGWSSPIVAAGRVYVTGDVGDGLVIFAFGLDGKLRWKAPNGAAWKGDYPGARACLAFSEGRLYHLNAHGRLACLDAESGKEGWAVDVLKEFQGENITWALSECLLVDGPRVIVTPGGRKALMAALDKATGRAAWLTEPLPGELATYSSPILFRHGGRRVLANCSSGHGFAVEADTGKLLWKVPLKNPYGTNVSSPSFGGGQVHFATAFVNGSAYRLRGDGVEEAWRSPFDTCTGSWVLAEGVLYGGGYTKFKHWIAVDWKSGERKGDLRELRSGAAVWADGRLTCLGEDGRVGLVTPVAEGFRLAGEFRLTADRVNDAWAHPVVADQRLYLRYHDTLFCYDVAAR